MDLDRDMGFGGGLGPPETDEKSRASERKEERERKREREGGWSSRETFSHAFVSSSGGCLLSSDHHGPARKSDEHRGPILEVTLPTTDRWQGLCRTDEEAEGEGEWLPEAVGGPNRGTNFMTRVSWTRPHIQQHPSISTLVSRSLRVSIIVLGGSSGWVVVWSGLIIPSSPPIIILPAVGTE